MDSADLAQFTRMVHDVMGGVVAIAVLMLCVALPVFLHYRGKARAMAVSATDQAGVQDLWSTARKMEARIGYLETVLDTEVPGWRNRGMQ